MKRRTEEEDDYENDDGDGDEDYDEADDDDDVRSRTRIQVDGWLTLEMETAAVAPLLCLRHRLSACFAAKVGPVTRKVLSRSTTLCAGSGPPRVQS